MLLFRYIRISYQISGLVPFLSAAKAKLCFFVSRPNDIFLYVKVTTGLIFCKKNAAWVSGSATPLQLHFLQRCKALPTGTAHSWNGSTERPMILLHRIAILGLPPASYFDQVLKAVPKTQFQLRRSNP